MAVKNEKINRIVHLVRMAVVYFTAVAEDEVPLVGSDGLIVDRDLKSAGTDIGQLDLSCQWAIYAMLE